MTRLRSFLETLLQDVRLAARTLRKSPGFSVIAIFTLALGIGANTAIFSVVDSALLRPLPYQRPSQLVQIGYGSDMQRVPAADFLAWREQAHSFHGMAALGDWSQMILSGNGSPDQVWTTRVSSDLFRTLGVRPVLGRGFAPGDSQGVVLSGEYWRAHFSANPRVIGQTLELDGKPFAILGVMPRNFFLVGSTADVWLPLDLTPAQAADYTNSSLMVVARLRSGVAQRQATAEIRVIQSRLPRPHSGAASGVSIAPLSLPPAGSMQTVLLALFGAVIFTLLIACANVASMFLARGTARHREMAVRAALGASRGRLARQLLTESMIVAGIGAIAGFALAVAALPVIAHLFPGFTASINLPVLAFTFGICLLTGILTGWLPAWKAARLDVNDSLKEGSSAAGVSSGRLRAQGALVVLEVALSLILLVGAGLMVESFHRLMTVHTGFNPDHVLTMRIPAVNYRYAAGAQTAAFYRRILQRIKTIPGVNEAAVANNFPLSDRQIMLTIYADADSSSASAKQIYADLEDVSPDFFRAMGIPLLRGRTFTRADTKASQGVAIVTPSMVRRYWAGHDPIGKALYKNVVIIGIAGDTVRDSLGAEPSPTVYRPFEQQPVAPAMATLIVRTNGDPLLVAPALRGAIWQIEPDQPVVNIRTMNELMADSVSQPRFSASVLSILGVLALLLSAVGIYGVISYSVSQRTHEMGVRVALGAQRSDVLKLILRRGLLLAVLGVAIGAAGAFGLTRFLASLLFGVTATDPAIFCGVALLLMTIALAACYIPARRAMSVDPVAALRSE